MRPDMTLFTMTTLRSILYILHQLSTQVEVERRNLSTVRSLPLLPRIYNYHHRHTTVGPNSVRMMPTVVHHAMGGVNVGSGALAVSEAGSRQGLIAACGRIVAVALPGASSIDLFDSADVAELSAVLGAGASKMRFIASFPVSDIADPVAIHALVFLRGGLLAIAGVCSRGSIIHAYKLSFTSTFASPNGTFGSTAPLSVAAAASLDTAALPQLVFRAALGILASAGGGASVIPLLLAHPTLPAMLGVVVPSDINVRFFDLSPPQGYTRITAFADCSAGVIAASSRGMPVTTIAFSRDGRILAAATADGRVAVFRLSVSEALQTGSLTINATRVRDFASETRVTALSVAHVPTAQNAHLFARFRENGYFIITGHTNGFLNVWWLGDNAAARAPGPLEARNAPRVRGGTSSHLPPPPPPPLPPTLPLEPLASYPPFHASRGPITHISAAFVVEDVPAGSEPLPRLFSAAIPRKAGLQMTSTVVVVGASGAVGWRVFSFPHLNPRNTPGVDQGAGTARGAGPPVCLRPDDASGAWSYGDDGRRIFSPPPPVDVSYLTAPAFSVPSFSDVLRAPIVGAPLSEAWASTTGNVLSARPGGGASGCEPRGTALLQLLPSADALFVGTAALTGATTDAGADVRTLFAGLGKEPTTGARSLFRSLSRAGAGNSAAGGGGGSAHAAFPGAPNFNNGFSRDASRGGREGGGFPNDPWGSFAMVPRALVLLLSERGIHAAGFDHHAGVVVGVRPEALAAHVVTSEPLTALSSTPMVTPPPLDTPPIVTQIPQTWACGAGKLMADAPRVRRTPAPLKRGAAEAAKRLNAQTLLRARTSYVPPVEIFTSSRHASVAPPPAPPSFPMASTGRRDAIVGGSRQLFHENDAAEAAAQAALTSLGRARGVALEATIERALRLPIQSAQRFGAATMASTEAAYIAARKVSEAMRAEKNAVAALKYMPRNSLDRLLEKTERTIAAAAAATAAATATAATAAAAAAAAVHVADVTNMAGNNNASDDLTSLLCNLALYSVAPQWENADGTPYDENGNSFVPLTDVGGIVNATDDLWAEAETAPSPSACFEDE